MKKSRTHHRCESCSSENHTCWCGSTHAHVEAAEEEQPKVLQSMFRWTAKIAAKKHQGAMAKDPDGLNHAVVQLRSKSGGAGAGGPVILIGCVCSRVFWKSEEVLDRDVEGDWAKPFRQSLGVRTVAPGGRG